MRVPDDARVIGVAEKVTGIVGSISEPGAGASIGEGRFARSRWSDQQQPAVMMRDTRCVDGGSEDSGYENQRDGFEKVITKIKTMLKSAATDPHESKTGAQVGRCTIFFICDEG